MTLIERLSVSADSDSQKAAQYLTLAKDLVRELSSALEVCAGKPGHWQHHKTVSDVASASMFLNLLEK